MAPEMNAIDLHCPCRATPTTRGSGEFVWSLLPLRSCWTPSGGVRATTTPCQSRARPGALIPSHSVEMVMEGLCNLSRTVCVALR